MSKASPAVIPDPYSLPLEDFDLTNPYLFQQDAHWGYFERLQRGTVAVYR